MSSKLVEQHIPCPLCPSSDAYCTYDDGHGFCFSCNSYVSSTGEKVDNGFTFEYLPWRGVTAETCRYFDCKTKVDGAGRPVEIGYPYWDGSYKIRKIGEKSFRSAGNEPKPGLFAKERFNVGSHRYITVTEGEHDCLSLFQVLHSPCVSVHSSSTAARDCGADHDYLASFERIYLAFDGDTAGREALRSVARLFDPNKIYVVKFTARKDANEYLVAGESQELRNIWNNSRRYLPENIKSSFADFEGILKTPSDKGLSYPLRTLSEMTYGLHLSESVLITAQEGVGKTELMHAIQYHILEQTNDNLGAFFIEEPTKRHLQSLAGIYLKAPAHLPDCGYSDDDVVAAIKQILRRDERLFVYSHFGSDDPDVLLDAIRFLVSVCGCRYIMLDHITMAVTGLAGEQDERRALDYLTSRLEMMVVELDFCLIMVSHVNDNNQTRGSRNAQKVANTWFHVTRDVSTGSNVINITLMKNRFGQKTGFAGSYAFDPVTRAYTEVAANDNDPETQAWVDRRKPGGVSKVEAEHFANGLKQGIVPSLKEEEELYGRLRKKAL